MSPTEPRGPESDNRSGRRKFIMMLIADIATPLLLYYLLRAVGVGMWAALVLGSIVPVSRIAITAVSRRRIEQPALFTLTLLVVATVVGFLTADPRLLMVRESYLTAVVGGWILLTLRSAQPLVLTATLGFLTPSAAASWRRAWRDDARFRRLMQGMTLAFGIAFLLDAAARVLMAYLLPLDIVPLLGAVLLVLLLIAVVQGGKAYGRRHLQAVLQDDAEPGAVPGQNRA
jgi:hypothetical protein